MVCKVQTGNSELWAHNINIVQIVYSPYVEHAPGKMAYEVSLCHVTCILQKTLHILLLIFVKYVIYTLLQILGYELNNASETYNYKAIPISYSNFNPRIVQVLVCIGETIRELQTHGPGNSVLADDVCVILEMPPKGKKSRPEWNQCVVCNLIIHGKNVDKHVEICGKNEFSREFGHVKNSKLCGITSPYNCSK